MASLCFFCNNSHPNYYSGSSPGQPAGSCDYCGLFCCDVHAYFDPNLSSWTCALCDSNNLIAHGIFRRGGPKLSVVLTTLVSSAMVREFAIYESFGAFLEQSPLAEELLGEFNRVYEIAPTRLTSEYTQALWEHLDEEGRRMVAAAIAIVLKFDVPDDRLVEILRILVTDFRQTSE